MTSQQIKAMKLALEALEDLGMKHFENTGEVLYQETFNAFKEALKEHAMQEVQRLGQEIEQAPYSVQQAYAMAQVCLDLHEAIGCKWGDNVYLAIDQLKAAAHPPQPEQEPMLLFQSHRDGFWCVDLTCAKCYSADFRLKHTTQPQRKPLTDEEIFACENSIPDEIVSDRDWCIHFARAIEAKIKGNT